jgi:hypothetical protein
MKVFTMAHIESKDEETMDVAVIHEHVFKEAKEGMEKANFEEDILEPCEYVSQNY